MVSKYVKKILEADVYEVAEQTPLSHAPLLSARLGNDVSLKREDLQTVFSFKVRGAYNRIKRLDPEARKRGVICASAGNHAQGVALAATKLGTTSHIVMGKNTPEIKVAAVKRFGGHVILHGDNFDDAAAYARTLVAEKGYTFIHPFNDPDVIAGQGTVGMELVRQHTGDLHAIFMPIGGGGLISGVGTYVKYLRPDVKIIGVEAEGSAAMHASLAAGRRIKLKAEELDLFADGTAVRQVGTNTFKIAKEVVDEVITVSVDEICAGIKDIFEDTRSISEPSGALSVAGMKKYSARTGGLPGPCIAVVSGANVNFDRLRHISERTEIGEQREILLGVTIPEKPGSFKRFCNVIGKRAITEFNYRYAADSSGAHVLAGIQTLPEGDDRDQLIEKLKSHYDVVDLSDNEVAILHVRHMVGGRAASIDNERLFRFEFPERPGALLKFLNLLGGNFNISMFHYRNHGSTFGRVLAGVQISDQELSQFKESVSGIGYRFWEETENPAYKLFLG